MTEWNRLHKSEARRKFFQRYLDGLWILFDYLDAASTDVEAEWAPVAKDHWRPEEWETYPKWLWARRQVLRPLKQFPVTLHKSQQEAAGWWVDGNAELHITIDLFYTRDEIFDEIARLLDTYGGAARSGPKDAMPFHTVCGLNAWEDWDLATNWLKAWKLDQQNTDHEDIARALGFDTTDEDRLSSSLRRVREYVKNAADRVASVRLGRFPDPDRHPDGQDDMDYERKRRRRKRMDKTGDATGAG